MTWLRTTVPRSYLAARRIAELRVLWLVRDLTRLSVTPHAAGARRRLAEMRLWCAHSRIPRLTTARRSTAARRRLTEQRPSWSRRRPGADTQPPGISPERVSDARF
jgi:hypothetical protein